MVRETKIYNLPIGARIFLLSKGIKKLETKIFNYHVQYSKIIIFDY